MKYIALFSVLLVLSLAACVQQPTEEITIGAIHTLSGDYVDFLHGNTNGLRMAVEDFEAETGITVRLIEEDDKSCVDRTGGANKLVSVDGVQAIVGTTCSSMTLSVAPIAEQTKTILVSGVSTSSAVTDAGDYIFRTIPSDGKKSVTVARELEENNYDHAAIVYDRDNDAAVTAVEDLKDSLTETSIIVNDAVGSRDLDFRTVLLKIRANDPDALVLAFTNPNQYAEFLTQYDQMGLKDVPVYVTLETIENDDVIELGGESVEGVLYPYIPQMSGETYESWAARYEEKYGEPVPTYAAESYDATMIALKAIATSDGTKENIQKKMFEIGNNYQGVSGTVTFDENGDVTKPLVMKTIKDGKFIYLE